jgi:uncharacterized membrane protein YbaN (DUF454 family)
MGLAVIGILLPVVPSVPFLIVAAFCFARSNPAWAQRLYDHPIYGASLRDWRDRGAIGRPAKYAAIVGMSIGVLFTLATVGAPLFLIPLGMLAIVGPWIWTRPE